MRDSTGDVRRLEATSLLAESDNGRIEAANQRLDSAARRALSGDPDCECDRTATPWSDRRILDPPSSASRVDARSRLVITTA